MQNKIFSNNLTKIAMENATLILGVNVILQSDLSNKVKGKTKNGNQMDKKNWYRQRNIQKIPSLMLQGGTTWYPNSIMDKSRRQKLKQKLK